MSERWHVVPDDDWIGHEERGDVCVCGPHVEFFPRGSVIVHQALDGRHAEDPHWARRRAHEVAHERAIVDELPA
jgi:hypothetical protein